MGYEFISITDKNSNYTFYYKKNNYNEEIYIISTPEAGKKEKPLPSDFFKNSLNVVTKTIKFGNITINNNK